MVKAAIAKMTNNKAAALSEVISDILKASGEVSPEWVVDVCNAIVKHIVISSYILLSV